MAEDLLALLTAEDLFFQDEELVVIPLCREAAAEIQRLSEENLLLKAEVKRLNRQGSKKA